jgi:hypothetical protein
MGVKDNLQSGRGRTKYTQWDYIQSINRSFVYKAKEGRHVRIEYNIPMEEKSKSYRQETVNLVWIIYLQNGC